MPSGSKMMSSDDFDEAVAASNSRLDHLYRANFADGSGAYFNLITLEDGSPTIEYTPPVPTRNRIKISVVFLRAERDIKSVTIKKFKHYKNEGWVEQMWGPNEPLTFTYFSFKKIAAFLRFLTEVDLAGITERRVALKVADGPSLDPETAAMVKELLAGDEGQRIVEEVLRSGDITSRDIVNISYRKKQVSVFERLLHEDGYLATYRTEHAIGSRQDEKVWQHFFKQNEWIFGYGLDYRFMGLIQDEADLATRDVANRGGSVGDYLMGFSNFTALVELKLPSTPLFTARTDRAKSWRLSADLTAAVSQILEQKASWQVKAEANVRGNFTEHGELVTQRTLDPRCILIVGSDKMFDGTEQHREVKLRTFELFRRDSRNIEIITYDELLERAKFIIGHSEQKAPAAEEPKIDASQVSDDDMPF